jgi:hypothetical protein
MCEADSSANHAHLFPPHKGSPPAANPKERYPIRGRIWQHALGKRSGRTAQLLACWDADGVRGRKYELGQFLNQHSVDNYLLNITLINSEQPVRLINCLPPHRQTDSRGWYSHTGPPWYIVPLRARSWPNRHGSYCHSSHAGRQTG